MAEQKFLVPIDLDQNELLNALLENIAGDPSTPSIGQVWYDTNNSIPKYYNGSTIKKFSPKSYVDSMAQGLNIHDPCKVTTDKTNIDLTSSSDPNPIDGITLSDGDRILLKDQTDPTENGVYNAQTAADPSSWTRSVDADEDTEVITGLYVFIEEGTSNADSSYILTTENPTLGSDDLSFTIFSSAGTAILAGTGLTKSEDTINHKPASVHESGGAIELDLANMGGTLSITSQSDHSAAEHESGGALALTFANLANIAGVSGIKMDIATNLTAGTGNRLCLETDTGRVLYDNGATFTELGLSENQISLANLVSHSHSDLSDAPTNAHISNLTDIPTRNHNDLKSISSDDHHTKYTDAEAQAAVGGGDVGLGNVLNKAQLAKDGSENLTGDLSDDQGNTIFDYSSQKIAAAIIKEVLSHSDLTDAPTNAHISNLTDIPTRNHNDLKSISTGDHRTDEQIQDLVNTLIAAGDKLSWTYDDSGNNLTIDTTALDEEEVDDFVDGMLQGGTAISLSRDDAANTLTISVLESGISLANLGSHSHSDLSDAPTNAHINNLTDIPTRNHNDLKSISSDDHHTKYTDAEAQAAVGIEKFTTHLTEEGGIGSLTYGINHNLGTLDVQVSVRENDHTPYDIVEVEVEVVDTNNITIYFAEATTIDYQITVVG